MDPHDAPSRPNDLFGRQASASVAKTKNEEAVWQQQHNEFCVPQVGVPEMRTIAL